MVVWSGCAQQEKEAFLPPLRGKEKFCDSADYIKYADKQTHGQTDIDSNQQKKEGNF